MFPTDYDFKETIESTSTKTNAQNKVGRNMKFDFAKKRFVLEDGVNVETSQVDAIKQWIELFIRTELNAYKIYSDTFGLNLDKLVGYRLPRSFIVSEIKRRITDGILNKVPCAVSVNNWKFDKGTFYFTVKTKTGEEVKYTYEY
ncbi:MAG: DUF2634 domain-containing protein [Veillonella sp.]|uniref:DUF2634 domain-containing protein n=1 Tax=Veillonella sp. TaxID=1926307 RepID=UPI0025EB7992|nr:DUF2634 domain-containing protein [Veillonella sp.]MBE6080176.1 DUF2634 domain-containing protein [Veillonella sp.]